MTVVDHKGYQGSVNYEDGHLVIKILHISDSISTTCDSASEVPSAFAELVEDYLETCSQIGKPPEKPFSGTFNVRVGPDLHRLAVRAAARRGDSLNSWVSAAIQERVQQEGPATVQLDQERWAHAVSILSQRTHGLWIEARHHHLELRTPAPQIVQLGEPLSGRTPFEVDFKSRLPRTVAKWKN